MTSIWQIKPTLEELNSRKSTTIHGPLGIQFTAVADDFIEGSMPVDERTRQPMGLLHGGASVVLAESLGSIGSYYVSGHRACVGLEISASHLKGIRSGLVYGRARPIRLGNSVHVWEIRIRENEKIDADEVCVVRLTVLVKR